MIRPTCPSGRLPPLHCACHNQRRAPLLPRSLGCTCGAQDGDTSHLRTTGDGTTERQQAWLCPGSPSLNPEVHRDDPSPWEMGEGAVEEKPGLYLGNHARTQTRERLFLPHLKDFRCSLSKTPRQFSGRQGPPLYLHSRGKAYSWCLVSVH